MKQDKQRSMQLYAQHHQNLLDQVWFRVYLTALAACVLVSSLLLDVLDDSDFRQRSLLVACNKSDYDMMCSSEKFIKHKLEKEIDELLSTRSKDVMSTDGEPKVSVIDSLLPEGTKFTFEAVSKDEAGSGGWDFKFGKCSAKEGEVDLVRDFAMA